MSAMSGWGKHYVARGWKLLGIHVLVNGACSCGQGQVCWDKGNAGKHPVARDWNNPLSAIQTDLQVERMWGDNVALQYSMGLLCGQPSKVWVLDIDPRNGGYESIESLEAEIDMPLTLKARTGGGGMHMFFKLPAGLILKKGPLHKDLPGIDVQAENSQIVLPPSVHRSGVRYAWETPLDTPIVEAPEALINLIKGSRGGAGGGSGSGIDLDKVMREGIPDGERNNTMYKVACKYARQFGVDSAEQVQLTFAAVKTFNQEFCSPPLELDEVLTLTNSAVGFIRANPGTKELEPELKAWLESQQKKSTPPDKPDDPTPPETGGTPVPDPVGPTPPPPGDVDVPSPIDGEGDDDGDPPAMPPDVDSLDDSGQVGGRSETDNGNARRIVDYHGMNLRYTPTAGWYRWDGLTWRMDDEQLYVTELARNLPQQIVAEMLNLPMAAAQASTLVDWAHKSRDAGRIRKAVALANSDPRIYLKHTQWDSNSDWLGVKNGVIDLRTGQLMKPDRQQYITKRTNIEYDPRHQDTRFKIFLEQVTGGDKEFQSWLQMVIGYTLTGDTSEQKFFLVYGPPGSGKSTILEIVRALLGEYSLSLQAESIMAQKYGSNNSDQYYTAEIEGRRMIAVSELPEAELMKEDAVKRLTGGDVLTGRRIAQQPFVFHSQAKLWVATNHRPRVKDPGVWRRMKAIPFEHVPSVVDPGLKPYLQSTTGGLPGVMSWAVEGAVRWYASRDGIGRCSVVDEATQEYKENEDEIGIFLSEEMRSGDGLGVGMYDVFQAYKAWLEDRGIMNAGPITKLQRSLGDRGLDIDGNGRRAAIKGWALQPRAVPVQQDDASSWGAMVSKARF